MQEERTKNATKHAQGEIRGLTSTVHILKRRNAKTYDSRNALKKINVVKRSLTLKASP